MNKSVLIINTPRSCNECACGKYDSFNNVYYCGDIKKEMYVDSFFKKRLKKCPLQDAEKLLKILGG